MLRPHPHITATLFFFSWFEPIHPLNDSWLFDRWKPVGAFGLGCRRRCALMKNLLHWPAAQTPTVGTARNVQGIKNHLLRPLLLLFIYSDAPSLFVCLLWTAIRYLSAVMGDGVASQSSNPEVTLDASRPNTVVNEQIFSLRLITNKLENAYNGMDVEWDGNLLT